MSCTNSKGFHGVPQGLVLGIVPLHFLNVFCLDSIPFHSKIKLLLFSVVYKLVALLQDFLFPWLVAWFLCQTGSVLAVISLSVMAVIISPFQQLVRDKPEATISQQENTIVNLTHSS